MKPEEKSTMKAIQLTGRDNSATWKSKDKGVILMSDMSDEYLQKALTTVQSRQLNNFNMLVADFESEKWLKQEAANRGLIILDFDTIATDRFAIMYAESKLYIKQLGAYLKTKFKKNAKEAV